MIYHLEPAFASNVPQLMISGETKVEASLFLHPGNRMSKSMSSGNIRTNNILLEVTVPRRTGRIRKRGSTDPYILEEHVSAARFNHQCQLGPVLHPQNTKNVLRSLRDNVGKYNIRPVGIIEQTHRFRGMLQRPFHYAFSPVSQNSRNDLCLDRCARLRLVYRA